MQRHRGSKEEEKPSQGFAFIHSSVSMGWAFPSIGCPFVNGLGHALLDIFLYFLKGKLS